MKSTTELTKRPLKLTAGWVFLGLALSLAAYPAPALAQAFVITSPPADSIFALGQDVTIKWTGGDPLGSVNVSLIERTEGLPFAVAAVVARGIPNSGTFDWTFPPTHHFGEPCEHKYQFYVENVERTSWTYGPILTVVCETPPAPFVITSPPADSIFALGQDVTIQWTGGDPLGSVNVSLIERTEGLPFAVAEVVATGIPNSGTFDWTFPPTHHFGEPCEHRYQFYVENVERTSWTYGPIFTVVCETPPKSKGATVLNDFGCVLLAGQWSGDVDLTTTKSHQVSTPSGFTQHTCTFTIPKGLEPNRAVSIKGFTCDIVDKNGNVIATTTDSRSVSTPGGQVILTCLIRREKKK